MEKYNLCLYYASRVYKPIIDEDFSNFREIDEYTMNFSDEKDLREKHSGRIKSIQFIYMKYIDAIRDPQHRNGKIVIVRRDDDGVSYIKPLYKSSYVLSSPKKLFSTIMEKLKKENNNEVLVDFLNKFRSSFYTEYNKYRGINKMKNSLYYHEHTTPTNGVEKHHYERLLSIIRDTLFLSYDKEHDTTDEKKYFKCRMMNDYLDSRCKTALDINSKIVEKCSKTKIKKDASKKISKTQKIQNNNIHSSIEDEHAKFIEKVIMDAYNRGEEPSLLDFDRAEYWKESYFFEEYFSKKGHNKK